jgi:PAS domain S-box-containing protein
VRGVAGLTLTSDHYRAMLRITGSAVLCLSENFLIQTWNRGAEAIFGYSLEEVQGRNFCELFLSEADRGPVETEIRKILGGELCRNYESAVRTRHGERILLWNSSRLKDDQDRVVGAAIIGQDVTELKRAQRLQTGESRALELLATDVDLEEVLGELARTFVSVVPSARCAVMLSAPDGRRLDCVATAGLGDEFRDAIRQVTVSSEGVACAKAASRGQMVVTTDVEADRHWDIYHRAARDAGIIGTWSQPIWSATGEILGTFDAYTRGECRPDDHEFEVSERLARLAGIAIEHRRIQDARIQETESRFQNAVVELETLREELQKKFSFDNLVAVSPAMLEVIRMSAQVSPTDATVLLTGETGTGKEVLARTIHANSSRKRGPFVAVNCGAIPETLMESELFGHEKGAFTGADRRKPGQVERARGGTLFLDEVGELVPGAQVKLLRMLQERTIERLGGTELLRIDVRVIAATNRDLAAEMEKGNFRDDLFYRLNVFHIHIPPLRERRQAIPILAQHILKRIAFELGRPEIGLSKLAMRVIEAHPWKGNVRELQNALERAAILSQGSLIGPEHLPIQAPTAAPVIPALHSGEIVARLDDSFSLAEFERRLTTEAMRMAGGNKSKAARLLGISRGSLRWRLDQTEGRKSG